jgi:hypothetical protein
MIVDYSRFSWGGLHGKHVVAWMLMMTEDLMLPMSDSSFKVLGLQEQLRNDSRVVRMEYTNESEK